MPDPFERRSRPNGCCEGIYSQPPRSQQRAAAVADAGNPEVISEGRRPPGKKDRSLCKAAHWKGPHQAELRIQEYGWRRTAGCRWAVSWRSKDGEPSWHCAHEEFCTGCGKILRTSITDGECPAFHPVTAAEREAVEAERAGHEARVAALRARNRWQPKPPPTGPQGYRRKRGA